MPSEKFEPLTDLDVDEFEFPVFAGNIKHHDGTKVEDYSITELGKYREKVHEKLQSVIKKEKSIAKKKSFKISEIVRHHRGIQKQEEEEHQMAINKQVAKEVKEIGEVALKTAKIEGQKEGQKKAYEEAIEQNKKIFTHFEEMVKEIVETKEQVLQVQKDQIIEMVKVLTKWVILRELKDDGDYIERLLEKLILESKTKESLLIQVNKDNFSRMPEVLKVVEERLGSLNNVRIEQDPDILNKGLVVESTNGILVGTLESQFKNLDKLFSSLNIPIGAPSTESEIAALEVAPPAPDPAEVKEDSSDDSE